ncbi:hypothetical protein Moror_15166 [Moniliophthora roreri MCA 2997]|uniref:Uncharacterized protein n=1 Tax=Moniliophthora roreri (strain MCA 2997) TaxID=1381753 RepID=V2X2T9_MONRO|nr:hypothetical protein Moror_15166 [Moniliophthora roreri MCA 2997]KAI3614539.1 hypothetical protein WG66_009795 [Moniliophthora roreri]
MFFLVVSLSFLIVTLNSAGQIIPWDSPTIIGILCASGMAFLAFWMAENHAKMLVAPPRSFVKWERRNVPIVFMIRVLVFFQIFANIFYFPGKFLPSSSFDRSDDSVLQVIGHSTLLALCLVIPCFFTAAIASIAVNELCRIYGLVRLLFIGGLMMLPVGLVGLHLPHSRSHALMSSFNETSSIGRIVGYSCIAGAALGSGTGMSMVIAQVRLPADELLTVTAPVSCAPGLGGTLGVVVVGAAVNNTPMNANDAVHAARLFPAGSAAHTTMVKVYVGAWRKGYWALLWISGPEILLCLFLKKVELRSGKESKDQDGHEKNEAKIEDEKSAA